MTASEQTAPVADAVQFVSVIVPVFNNSARLKLCLDALQNQSYPQGFFEVIVVDNGSDQDLESIVRNYPEVKYEYEKFPTSYAARNRGIASSRGRILAFTDSDCIPARDWIENGVQRLLQNPECGLVAGAVRFYFMNPAKPSPVELYSSLTFLPQERLVKSGSFGATANLFTFRSVIEKFGVFDPLLKSSGDVEFGRRIAGGGLALLYADEVVVLHPACRSLPELYRRIVRIEGGFYDIRQKQLSLYGSAKYLYKKVLIPSWFWKQLVELHGISPGRKARTFLVAVVAKALRISEYIRLQITRKSRQFRR